MKDVEIGTESWKRTSFVAASKKAVKSHLNMCAPFLEWFEVLNFKFSKVRSFLQMREQSELDFLVACMDIDFLFKSLLW